MPCVPATRMHVCVCVYVCMYVCIQIYAYICVYAIPLYLPTYLPPYLSIYLYIYIYTHVYVYIYMAQSKNACWKKTPETGILISTVFGPDRITVLKLGARGGAPCT